MSCMDRWVIWSFFQKMKIFGIYVRYWRYDNAKYGGGNVHFLSILVRCIGCIVCTTINWSQSWGFSGSPLWYCKQQGAIESDSCRSRFWVFEYTCIYVDITHWKRRIIFFMVVAEIFFLLALLMRYFWIIIEISFSVVCCWRWSFQSPEKDRK